MRIITKVETEGHELKLRENQKIEQIKKLEALELWCYRRILNIPRVQLITNAEVLTRSQKDLRSHKNG